MSSDRQYASHARILHKQCSRMVCIFCSTTRNRLPFSGLVTKSRFREFKQGNGVLTRPDLRSTYTQLRTRSPTLSSFDNPEISSRFHFEGVMDQDGLFLMLKMCNGCSHNKVCPEEGRSDSGFYFTIQYVTVFLLRAEISRLDIGEPIDARRTHVVYLGRRRPVRPQIRHATKQRLIHSFYSRVRWSLLGSNFISLTEFVVRLFGPDRSNRTKGRVFRASPVVDSRTARLSQYAPLNTVVSNLLSMSYAETKHFHENLLLVREPSVSDLDISSSWRGAKALALV